MTGRSSSSRAAWQKPTSLSATTTARSRPSSSCCGRGALCSQDRILLLCLTGNFVHSAMPCCHLLRVFYAVFWAFQMQNNSRLGDHVDPIGTSCPACPSHLASSCAASSPSPSLHLFCHVLPRCSAICGPAASHITQSYQLPPNCDANTRQAAGACQNAGRTGRRSNASTILAEDLRQALRRAVVTKKKNK